MMQWWTCEHGNTLFGFKENGCFCRTSEKAATGKHWVRWIKLLRNPKDKGVGDTVQRIAAKFGGERFKAFSKRIGIPCGCTERQEQWNSLWPY